MSVAEFIDLAKFIGPLAAGLLVALVAVSRTFISGKVIPAGTHQTIVELKDGIIAEKDAKILVLESIVQEQRLALGHTLRVAEQTAAIRSGTQ